VRAVQRNVAILAALAAVAIGASYGVPAYAQAVTDPVAVPTAAAAAHVRQQTYTAAAIVAPIAIAPPDSYTVTAPPPLQWPVDPGVGISDGFGARVSPCAGCSSNHEGVDFDPGYGAQIHAIAAGVVVETNNPGYSALGVHVAIQHIIGGQTIVSAYGHMQLGSMPLHVGDTVAVGQVIGLVGSTGASTGPHLHFEIRVNGNTPVDPLSWMHARLG
jgi:murein DD-endopeptidase MepM/ murein hydrolase activator NlpD